GLARSYGPLVPRAATLVAAGRLRYLAAMSSTPHAEGAESPRPDLLRPLRYAYRVPLLLLHLLIALPLTLLLINDFSARIRVAGVPLPHWAIRLWSSGMMRIFGWRS